MAANISKSICHSINPTSSLSFYLQYVTLYQTSERPFLFPLFRWNRPWWQERSYILNHFLASWVGNGSVSKSHSVRFGAAFQKKSVHWFHRFGSIFDRNRPMFYPTSEQLRSVWKGLIILEKISIKLEHESAESNFSGLVEMDRAEGPA